MVNGACIYQPSTIEFNYADSNGVYHGGQQIVVEQLNQAFILFRLRGSSMVALVCMYLITMVVAFIAKYTIFKMITITGLRQRPINLLIMIDQGLNTLHRTITLIMALMTLVLQSPMDDYIGHPFCEVATYIVTLGPLFKVPGSLGINIYRLCYLKILVNLIDKINWMAVAVFILITSQS